MSRVVGKWNKIKEWQFARRRCRGKSAPQAKPGWERSRRKVPWLDGGDVVDGIRCDPLPTSQLHIFGMKLDEKWVVYFWAGFCIYSWFRSWKERKQHNRGWRCDWRMDLCDQVNKKEKVERKRRKIPKWRPESELGFGRWNFLKQGYFRYWCLPWWLSQNSGFV